MSFEKKKYDEDRIDSKLNKAASLSFKRYLKQQLEEEIEYDGVDTSTGMLPPARSKSVHIRRAPIDTKKIAYSKSENLFRLSFDIENFNTFYVYIDEGTWYDIKDVQVDVSLRLLDAKGKEWRIWHDVDGKINIIDDNLDVEGFANFNEVKNIISKFWK